ncbi:MAG: AMP-binding protein [Phycisphaerales bacterium]
MAHPPSRSTHGAPTAADSHAIESALQEGRVFDPPKDFARRVGGAHVTSMAEYRALWKRSIDDPEGFWGEIAAGFDWFKPWDRVLEWNCPDARWFVGAKTNVSHNALDRHVLRGHGDEVALVWEAEPTASDDVAGAGPQVRRITYRELLQEVCAFANVLKALGVRKGEVVTIYMGMVPELVVAMLACARIGAPHSVIFGGFSSQAIVDRVTDAHSRVVVTCDGAWRRGQIVPLKENVDRACEMAPTIEHVIVLRRCGNGVQWNASRDHWWHDVALSAPKTCACEWQGARICSSCSTSVRRAAQGHPPHHRRLHGLHRQHGAHHASLAPGRPPLLVHGRHRLDHRPFVHRLWTAAQPRADPDVRRRAPTSPARTFWRSTPSAIASPTSTA